MDTRASAPPCAFDLDVVVSVVYLRVHVRIERKGGDEFEFESAIMGGAEKLDEHVSRRVRAKLGEGARVGTAVFVGTGARRTPSVSSFRKVAVVV